MKLLYAPLGLGDVILCSGLINKLSLKEKIAIPVFPHNLPSVESFFAHNKNVSFKVIVREDIHALKEEYDVIEFDNFTTRYKKNYAAYFYEFFGFPYSDRLEYCRIADNARLVEQLPVPKKPYVLLHYDHRPAEPPFSNVIEYKGKYGIYKPEQFFPWFPMKAQFPSILRYRDIIMGAKEFHVIDSSWFNLIECLQPEGKGFLYINKKRWSSNFTSILKKKWEIIE